jgi:hypothetical protein
MHYDPENQLCEIARNIDPTGKGLTARRSRCERSEFGGSRFDAKRDTTQKTGSPVESMTCVRSQVGSLLEAISQSLNSPAFATEAGGPQGGDGSGGSPLRRSSIGPEPCVVDRDAEAEASAGVRTGKGIEPRRAAQDRKGRLNELLVGSGSLRRSTNWSSKRMQRAVR